MIKKNGFTLVELLATIALLSIIAMIIYPNVTRYFNKSKEDAFGVQIKEIKKAAHEWTLKHSNLLPEKEGERITIYLIDLKRDGLIDKDLMNPKTNRRFPDDMVILIIKGKNGFDYEVDIDSGTEESDTDLDKPSLILKGYPYQYVEINDTYVEKGALATDSKGNKIDEDEIKITIKRDNLEQTEIKTNDFYEYEILYEVTDPYNGKKAKTNRRVKIRDTIPPELKVPVNTTIKSTVLSYDLMEGVSANDNSKEPPVVTVNGNVSLGIPGDYIVNYTAEDSSGNKTTKKRAITVVKDICLSIKIKGNVASSVLTNKNVTLETTYINNTKPIDGSFQWQKYDNGWKNISGETSSKIILSKDTNTKYRVVYNYGDCSVTSNEYSVFIDKTKPVLQYTLTQESNSSNKITGNSSSGNVSKSFTSVGNAVRTFSYTETGSGFDYAEYNSGSGWKKEGNFSRYVVKSNSKAKYRIKDKAGNYSNEVELNITIKPADPDINFKISCSRTCSGNCNLEGYNNDSIWTWTMSGIGSGAASGKIDYSTQYVDHYWVATVTKEGKQVVEKSGGKGIFELPTRMRFSRSYANQTIVGTVCTKNGKCKSCTVTK